MPTTPTRPPLMSLNEARAKLAAPERRERMLPVLAAAALAAASAIALAASVILGPPGTAKTAGADPIPPAHAQI